MNWALFWSTFGLVFMAELGDKTQLTVLAQSAATNSPWTVFAAGSAALVAASAVGAVAGSVLSRYVSPRMLNVGGGVLFVVLGVMMVWRALAGGGGTAP